MGPPKKPVQDDLPKRSTFKILNERLKMTSTFNEPVFNERSEYERRGTVPTKRGTYNFPGDVVARDEGDGYEPVAEPVAETPEAPAVIHDTPSEPPVMGTVAGLTPDEVKQAQMMSDERDLLAGESKMQAVLDLVRKET